LAQIAGKSGLSVGGGKKKTLNLQDYGEKSNPRKRNAKKKCIVRVYWE